MRPPNRVIIFDWDDTICPSTFLDRNHVSSLSSSKLSLRKRQCMLDIAICAERCLSLASKYGNVIIVTNADNGWVEYSAQEFLPSLATALAKYTVISARASYQQLYPKQPLCWKAAAIAEEVLERFTNDDNQDCWGDGSYTSRSSCSSSKSPSSTILTNDNCMRYRIKDKTRPTTFFDNRDSVVFLYDGCPNMREIISFGDSTDESTAVTIVASQLGVVPKIIKFLPLPSPFEILGQLSLIADHMDLICCHPTSLDLELSPTNDKKNVYTNCEQIITPA